MNQGITDNELFYSYVDICTRDELLPINILKVINIINSICYAYVNKLLRKYKKIYDRWKTKFANKLYSRLIKYPFEYDGTARTVSNFNEMRFNDINGLQIFDHDPLPFSEKFLTENRIGFKNIILWCTKPRDFISTIIVQSSDGTSNLLSYIYHTEDQFIKIIDHPDNILYMLDMKLPFSRNQILLGSPIIPHTSIYLGCAKLNVSGDNHFFVNDPDFYSDFISRVIVLYDYVSSDKYNFMPYRAHFQISLNNVGIKTKSVIEKVQITSCVE